MKKHFFISLAVLFFISGCYTQYKFVYEIDRLYPQESSDYYSWEGQEKKEKGFDWSTTKQTSNPDFKYIPVKNKIDKVEIHYKNYEVYNWYKKNYYVDRTNWVRGYSIWEPSLYSPYYGYRYNQWYWRNGWRYGNHWNFYYWNYRYPKNNIVIINKDDNKRPNKSRRGGFGNTDYNKPSPKRDYFDGTKRSGSSSTKVTKPRSTGRSSTVNPPTKSSGGSSKTRSTGRTTTKKTKT